MVTKLTWLWTKLNLTTYKMKKYFLFLILFIFTLGASAGDGQKQQKVDSLLVKVRESHQQADFVQQLEKSLQALDIATTANYDKESQKLIFLRLMRL